jgi:cytochrome c553
MRILPVLALPVIALATSCLVVRAEPAKGDRALGEYLAGECVACHQVTGQANGAVPSIVAWPEDQFIAVMQSYKNKDRDNQIMQTLAGRLSASEIEALAAYFGSLTLKPMRN